MMLEDYGIAAETSGRLTTYRDADTGEILGHARMSSAGHVASRNSDGYVCPYWERAAELAEFLRGSEGGE